MEKDKLIREKISELESLCNEYLIFCDGYNECAFSDKLLEKIFYKCEKINKIHNSRFDNKRIKESGKNGAVSSIYEL